MCKRLVMIATALAACTAMGCCNSSRRQASYNPCAQQPYYQTGYANQCCCDPCGGMGGGAVIGAPIAPTPVYPVQ
jgi:hypothetical protein